MSAPQVIRDGTRIIVALLDVGAMVWIDATQPGQVWHLWALGSSAPMTWQEAHRVGVALVGMAELSADDRGAQDTDVDGMREHYHDWDGVAQQVIAELAAAHAELEAQS